MRMNSKNLGQKSCLSARSSKEDNRTCSILEMSDLTIVKVQLN